MPVAVRDQRFFVFLEAAELIAHKQDVGAEAVGLMDGGGLTGDEPFGAGELDFGIGDLDAEAGDVAFDFRAGRGAPPFGDGLGLAFDLGEPGLGGFEGRLEFDILHHPDGRAGGDFGSFVDPHIEKATGPFGAEGRPGDGFHLTVGVQGIDQILQLRRGETDFGRGVFQEKHQRACRSQNHQRDESKEHFHGTSTVFPARQFFTVSRAVFASSIRYLAVISSAKRCCQ